MGRCWGTGGNTASLPPLRDSPIKTFKANIINFSFCIWGCVGSKLII